jgi:hypothetical protein
MTQTPPDAARTRGRWILVGLFALFFGTVFGAGVLRFAGWQPTGHKNSGEMLQPPIDARAITPQLAAGGAYAWNPNERIWRIVAVAPADCGQPCSKLAQDLDKVWRLFGHRADKVQILWVGPLPAHAPATEARVLVSPTPALLAALPRHADARGVPVYVIDPNGFVILRYPPRFDAGGLYKDVSKLLKLM